MLAPNYEMVDFFAEQRAMLERHIRELGGRVPDLFDEDKDLILMSLEETLEDLEMTL